MLASSPVSGPRSTASKHASTRPASMLEKSSSEFTSRSSRRLLRCATATRSCTASSRAAAPSRSSSSSGPIISISGVRNSWLMLEKNAVFARSSAASASARARVLS